MGITRDLQIAGRLTQSFINTYCENHPAPKGFENYGNMNISSTQTVAEFWEKELKYARQGVRFGPPHQTGGKDAPLPKMAIGLYKDPSPSYDGS